MKAKEIIQLMNKWAPPTLIEDWDNTGFQIGDDNKEVNKILVALDLSGEVCKKAIDEDFQMIITHHPLIFKPLSSITTSNYKENLIYNLIKKDIVVYNAHTNLDKTDGGVNHQLGKILGLYNDTPLGFSESLPQFGFGRVGDIEKTQLKNYINVIKDKLDIDYLKVYGNQEREVQRVAVCGGSGSEFIMDAYRKGACIYITGDIKYHDAQLGTELGLTIIDAGHYHTEKIILPFIKEYLERESKYRLDIEIWDQPSPTYKIY